MILNPKLAGNFKMSNTFTNRYRCLKYFSNHGGNITSDANASFSPFFEDFSPSVARPLLSRRSFLIYPTQLKISKSFETKKVKKAISCQSKLFQEIDVFLC